MQPDGTESQARWREAGEWWNGDTGKEIHRYIDASGNRREEIQALAQAAESPETTVRIRRIRDEKVSLATGLYTPSAYGLAKEQRGEGVLLHAQSAYAFNRGTILAGELPAIASERGYGTVLMADPFSLVGAREFCKTAKEVGVKPLVGATFELEDGGEIVLVARTPLGYCSLSRLITQCHLSEPRLYPLCRWSYLERHTEGLLCLTGGSLGPLDLLLAKRSYQEAEATLDRLIHLYGRDHVVVQVERSYLPWQMSVEKSLIELAKGKRVLVVGGGPVIHTNRDHFPAHDVLVCIDSLCLIDEIEGRKPPRDPSQPLIEPLPRRSLNAERCLRNNRELKSLYNDQPELIENAKRVADMCEDYVLPGRINLPRFCDDEDSLLANIVEAGAIARYPAITNKLRRRMDKELQRMIKLGWSRHFLIAWEMCEWAKSQDILLSGRGSVVDSVVAYCLGISRIDACGFDLHFERFLPPDGSKRPDIDIDFEAARREDVRQHLVQRYGDAHVATVAAIGTYGTKGILREVGKVMGISESVIRFLAKRLHGSVSPERLQSALDNKPELRDSNIPRERLFWVFQLAERMGDLPRNLRAHSSGVILSEVPVCDIVPVQLSGAEGVKIIQWDKRSSKHSFDKFDVLCLRGNDVLGGTMRRVESLDVCDLPLDDPDVYRTMRAGQLIGIPQSASPAMRQAHIRIGTENLKDAGIVQAGIRPGVGGAVKLNEFVARRRGKHFEYAHPDLEEILGPTLGIVVFQEQIDQLLEKFGGYTGDEAEEIREAVQRHYVREHEGNACEEVLHKIVAKGYPYHVAQEVYELVSGFKGYGFAEGHALSFAEISVRSIYCQQNYPSQYFAALLDAQPAGYYGPATIANEARSRGVQVLRPDINLSDVGFKVEDVKATQDPEILIPGGGFRVPLKQITDISIQTLERAILNRPYASLFDFAVRVQPHRNELENMILAGAFDSFSTNRRAMLWMVSQAIAFAAASRNDGGLPLLFDDPPLPTGITDFKPVEKAIIERRLMGMDIEKHLMAFERPRVAAKGGITSAEASTLNHENVVFVVGNPIRLRFPPTKSGKRVMFFDLEDETGLLNVTCFDDVYQRDGHKVICNPFVTLLGTAQNRDGHIAFMAQRIIPYRPKSEAMQDEIPIKIGDFLMS